MVEELVITRTYAASPDRVWTAWTDPIAVARWYCPNPALPTTARLDVRPGGDHEVDMGEQFTLRGRYVRVEPGRALAHTWAFNGGHETAVCVELAENGTGTTLTLTHHGFEDDAERAGIEQGWTASLQRLEQVLRR